MADASAEAFASAVIRVAAAQVCCSAGFRAAQSSALDALAEVLARYLQSLGAGAAAAANSAGRTQCNLLDVAAAVAELRLLTGGCPGAWDHRAGWAAASAPLRAAAANSAGRTQCNLLDVAAAVAELRLLTGGCPGAWDHRAGWAAASAPLREIKRFVETTTEVPFARPIRRGVSPARRWRSSRQLGVAPPAAHVPAWLPAFPDCEAEERAVAVAADECGAAASERATADRPGEAGGPLPLERGRERVSFSVGPTVGGRKKRGRWVPLQVSGD